MPALADLVQPFFDLLGLPHWAGAATVLAALLLALPWILRNRRTDRARTRLKEALRAHGPERARLEAEALAEVSGHPMGLLVLAEAAHAAGREQLCAAAMAELRASGRLRDELRRLERSIEGPMPASPMEAAIKVEQMRAEGAVLLAEESLARYLARWPSDPELLALKEPK